MMNRFVLTAALSFGLAQVLGADPTPPTVGSVWGHSTLSAPVVTAGPASIYGDPLAHAVGDLVTIVVTLQNTVSKAQNTTTAKTTAVDGTKQPRPPSRRA